MRLLGVLGLLSVPALAGAASGLAVAQCSKVLGIALIWVGFFISAVLVHKLILTAEQQERLWKSHSGPTRTADR